MSNDPELRDAIRELGELVKYSAIATNDQKHAALYRVCRHLTNVLKTVTRSHPAPPPSPSEENVGAGASDGELGVPNDAVAAEAFIDRYRDDVREVLLPDIKRALRAGYYAGLERGRHQASADAATIAGLRSDLTEAEARGFAAGRMSVLSIVGRDRASYERRDMKDRARALQDVMDECAKAASLRPEPDELTDGPDPIHEGDR